MAFPYVTLQYSEQVLVTAAATIYSGSVAARKLDQDQEAQGMDRAIKAACRITTIIDTWPLSGSGSVWRSEK